MDTAGKGSAGGEWIGETAPGSKGPVDQKRTGS